MKGRHYKALVRLEGQFATLRKQAGDTTEHMPLPEFALAILPRNLKGTIAFYQRNLREYAAQTPAIRSRIADLAKLLDLLSNGPGEK